MNKDLNNIDYYIGLDCGTSSVGFAVTDKNYNILKFNGKRMWGSHLFEKAKTAAGRRGFRTARRRLERRRKRILLLQEIFAEEICKVDPTFFIRLNDSKYILEDKTAPDLSILFNDKNYKDKDFFKIYPTAYHLRKALMTEDIKDPRLLYLGIQHILKNRGHFLFPGEGMKAVKSIKPLVYDIQNVFEELFDDATFEYTSIEKLQEALMSKRNSEKKEKLEKEIIISDTKLKASVVRILLGYKVKTTTLFKKEGDEIPDVEFKKASFEESDLPELQDRLSDEEFAFIKAAKGIYDWTLLASIMSGHLYISDAKIELFDSNKADLKHLKEAIKTYAPDKYESFFHSDEKGSYSSYTGKIHGNHVVKRVKRTGTDEFYKKIKNLLEKVPKDDEHVKHILDAIENDSFMPLLKSFRNGTIPWQMNKIELDAILANCSKNFEFLEKKDPDGFSATEKIKELLKFRVPYYVGPLGSNPYGKETKGKNSWVERKTSGRVLPWNIEQKIDYESSAEKFIERMTNKCTYCKDQDVLPKNSLEYSKYMVLNELNNLRICGDRLSVPRKQEIFNELFKKEKKVSISKLTKYINDNCWYSGKIKKEDITGIDGDLKASLSSYFDFKDFLESHRLKADDVDRIIKWATVFSEGGDMLRKRIEREFGEVLTKEEIDKTSKLKYAGWGRFSHKFLYEIQAINKETGELMSVMRMLWETQNNLMELLSNKYEFIEQITKPKTIGKLDYSIVDEMYVSPAVKKETWQTLRIVDELIRIMGHNPKKVFVEVTRSEQEKKRTVSRKQTLIDTLKDATKTDSNYINELRELISKLEEKSENEVSRQDKLYLYFSQCGKCMYTGERIDIEDLYNTKQYDIDHIFPQSRTNDDSLTNRVLVKNTENRRKSDVYPIDDSIRTKMQSFWKFLYEKKFIPKEKYDRLVRTSPLSDEEINGFINRQLVETSQTVKQVTDTLKSLFGEETKVVYSKARNVSDFRNQYGFVKCRSMNDLHHAKDAYLNIVVGNVYDTKYSSNFYLQANGHGYGNLTKLFDFDVKNAWKVGASGTLSVVAKTMNRNDILFTRQPVTKSGQLFDLQLVKKGAKKGALPAKVSDKKLQSAIESFKNKETAYDNWTAKYGGYNSLATSHFAVIKHEEKNKRFVSFVPISMIDAKRLEKPEALLEHCTTTLGLINPTIVRSKLLINTQLKIDGYLFAITGKSTGGKALTLSSNVPLVLSAQSQQTVKNIESFFKKSEKNKDLQPTPKFDKISTENTLDLYCELQKKSKSPIYNKRPGNQSDVLENGVSLFEKLSLLERCKAIREILNYYAMEGNGQSDFTAIGGSKTCGKLTKKAGFDITKSNILIFDQSITGLFEEIEEIKA